MEGAHVGARLGALREHRLRSHRARHRRQLALPRRGHRLLPRRMAVQLCSSLPARTDSLDLVSPDRENRKILENYFVIPPQP